MDNSRSSLITLGATFASYEDFDIALKEHSKAHFTHFSIVNGERISNGHPLQPIFRYHVLRLQCKQGQKRYSKPKDNPVRPHQRSYKVGCPVMLNLRLNQPRNQPPCLKITKLVLEHDGHVVTPEVFNLYPEQRRIQTEAVSDLCKMNVPNNVLLQHVKSEYGKELSLTDIRNLKTRVKAMEAAQATSNQSIIEADGQQSQVSLASPPSTSYTPTLKAPAKRKSRDYNQHDIFGNYVAHKLGSLPHEQRIYAEKKIYDVLFEAEIAALASTSSTSSTPMPTGMVMTPQIRETNGNTGEDNMYVYQY